MHAHAYVPKMCVCVRARACVHACVIYAHRHTHAHARTHARTHARAHAHNDNDDDNSLHCFGSSVVLKPLARAPNHKQHYFCCTNKQTFLPHKHTHNLAAAKTNVSVTCLCLQRGWRRRGTSRLPKKCCNPTLGNLSYCPVSSTT